jgi:hypothetical protein
MFDRFNGQLGPQRFDSTGRKLPGMTAPEE